MLCEQRNILLYLITLSLLIYNFSSLYSTHITPVIRSRTLNKKNENNPDTPRDITCSRYLLSVNELPSYDTHRKKPSELFILEILYLFVDKH